MKKTRRNPEVSWSSVFRVLRCSELPWLWILIAFAVNLYYNELLLKIPTTTAALFSGEFTGEALWDTVWYYLLFALIMTVWNLFMAQACCLAVKNARGNLWGKMLGVRMSFYDGTDPAELMSAVTNDISFGIDRAVYQLICIIPTLYYVVRAIRTIGSYHWLLVVGIVTFVPLKYVYSYIMGKFSYRVQAGIYEEIGGLTGFLAERVRNLPLIKTFTNEKNEREKGRRTVDRLVRANMRAVKMDVAYQSSLELLDFVQRFVLIVLAVILIQQKKINMQQWVAFFLFSENLSSSMSQLINEWLAVKMVKASLCRAAKIYDAPCEESEYTGGVVPETGRDVCFEGVTFSYGEKAALRDVSFTVPEGKSMAIVGLCGSGKTTSLNLLERFYRPDGGEITMGGVDIRHMPLDRYRRC